jgi:uncharacterized BrkB/YihY/UPF0761 family membrane protein
MLDGHADALALAERPDPVATISVILLGVSIVGLVLGGILAIYDWRTPAAERPLFWVVLGTFVAAVTILIVGATFRWARTAPR